MVVGGGCPYLRAASPMSFRSVSATSLAAPKDTSSGASSSEEGGLRRAAGSPRFPFAAAAFLPGAIFLPHATRPPRKRSLPSARRHPPLARRDSRPAASNGLQRPRAPADRQGPESGGHQRCRRRGLNWPPRAPPPVYCRGEQERGQPGRPAASLHPHARAPAALGPAGPGLCPAGRSEVLRR